MSKDIEPMLSQIQRELVLVVEYKPGTPISVALSRKTNIAELLDAKKLEIDPEVEHKEIGPRRKKVEKIAPATGLYIHLKDGEINQEKDAKAERQVLNRHLHRKHAAWQVGHQRHRVHQVAL